MVINLVKYKIILFFNKLMMKYQNYEFSDLEIKKEI